MINYKRLADSIKFYEKHSFKHIEVPWTVAKAVSDITRPPGAGGFTINEKNKVLLASGEQGFLYLYLKGFLPKGRFQTITPCFRDESFDVTHTKYFMKNELISTERVDAVELDFIIKLCQMFHEEQLKCRVDVVNTGENMYDLYANGVEVGSYGIRHCSFLSWIYATGVAEPRASIATQLAK